MLTSLKENLAVNSFSNFVKDSHGLKPSDKDCFSQVLIIIDGSIAHPFELIAGAKEHVAVRTISADANGISQVAEILKDYPNLQTVHLIAHGIDQGIQLGNGILTVDNINHYRNELAAWAQSLDTKELVLYSCELASTAQGLALIHEIQNITGAHIAASGQLVGNGQWNFDRKFGDIEVTLPFTSTLLDSYQETFVNYVVTTLEDENDGGTTPGSVGKGLSLREAVRLANDSKGVADTISFNVSSIAAEVLAAAGGSITGIFGDAKPTINLKLGKITISDTLVINGLDQNALGSALGKQSQKLTISGTSVDNAGQSSANDNIFLITDGLSSRIQVTLDNLIFANGKTVGSERGGAIRVIKDDLTVTNSVFLNNYASLSGGAISSVSGSQLNIIDTVFQNNSTDGQGGAIYITGVNNKLTLERVTINNNTGTQGGGIYSVDSEVVSNNSTLIGNQASAEGGAIYTSAKATFTQTSVRDNTATGSGGGIYTNGDVTINQASVINNTSGNKGGGLFAAGSTTITEATVEGNTATNQGGGLYATGSTVLTNGTFSGNQGKSGGGLYTTGNATLTVGEFTGNKAIDNGGGIYNNGQLSLVQTKVTGNQAIGDVSGYNSAIGNGGGIFNNGTASLTTASSLENNAADSSGGGLFNSSTGSINALSGVKIDGNTANDYSGGGIFNAGSISKANILTISNNTAKNYAYGGGVSNAGNFTIANSSVYNNNAYGGGGFFNNNSGNLTISNSTVSGNSSTGNGGGIFNTSGTVNVNSSTVTNNAAASGGGIFTFNNASTTNTTKLVSTILAKNVNDSNVAGDISGKPAIINNAADKNFIGGDPLLKPLDNNGGATKTHRLVYNSPARNAGVNTNDPLLATPTPLAFDQRGNISATEQYARVFDGAADVGSYELAGEIDVEKLIRVQPLPQVILGDTFTQVTQNKFNIAIVIDVSGSMGWDFAGGRSPAPGQSRLDYAKTAIKAFINDAIFSTGIAQNSSISLIPFASNIYTSGSRAYQTFKPGSYASLTAFQNALNTKIDGLLAEGGTEYENPLRRASNWIRGTIGNDLPDTPAANANNRIYFLSDGADNSGYNIGSDANLVKLYDGSIPNFQIQSFGFGSGADFKPDELDLVEVGTTLPSNDPKLNNGLADFATIVNNDPNNLSDVLRATNIVEDLAGQDLLQGGYGNDIMIGDNLVMDTATQATYSGLTTPQAKFDFIRNYINGLTGSALSQFNSTGQSDTLIGGVGDDIMYGQGGNDILIGQGGSDTLYGGTGADTFVYESVQDGGTTFDSIMDFTVGVDKIDLSNIGITTSNFASRVQLNSSNSGGSTTINVTDLNGVSRNIARLFWCSQHYDVDQ
ncbi:MAG: DUF4347 domain-containing protein [Synechococcaceae cyanobacterium RL_1_2]|nr:DUF4347 domain-containing protein [Synechococcaceae cyanobacterium RL_1_2]